MTAKQFDIKFQELYTKLVSIAFEYVNRNKEEVDTVYVYAEMEGGYFYNVFYKINGHIVKNHKINLHSKIQYDISEERQSRILGAGDEYLRIIAELFKEDGREVPNHMKMVYYPKTGAFNNDISYDIHHNDAIFRGSVEVFNEWFVAMGGVL